MKTMTTKIKKPFGKPLSIPDILPRWQHAEFCLKLYHEAWNGVEGDWHSAMRVASKDTARYLKKYKVYKD